MRRVLFPFLGLVEIAVAALLVFLGLSLPDREEVRRSFAGASQVTSASGDQVRAIRGQIAGLRGAGLRPTADRLGEATRVVTSALRSRRVGEDEVRALRDATDRAAAGLEGLARSFDPEALSALGEGLGTAADVLDRILLPAVDAAALDLEGASDRLSLSARSLAELLEEVPLDLAPIREIHDGLVRFDDGFAAMDAMLDPSRLAPMRAAAEGAEGVVREAGRLASRAAGYSYPIITFQGLTPRIQSRPFWPAGAKVSADMRQVAGGVTAMGRELETLARELPKIQETIRESRRALDATRGALGAALERQDEVDRLLKEMPAHAARLAEALPRLSANLARALREAARLRDAVEGLRRVRAAIDASAADWPRVREALAGTATILSATRDQLDLALRNRREVEAAMGQVEALATDLASLSPQLADRIEVVLAEEDRTLAELEGGISTVDRTLPAFEAAILRCLDIGRALACLVALIAALHGAFLIACALRAR